MEQRDKDIMMESVRTISSFLFSGISLTIALAATAVSMTAAAAYEASQKINGYPNGKEEGWMYKSSLDIIKSATNYTGNSSSSTGEGNSASDGDESVGDCEDTADAKPSTGPPKEDQLYD